MVFPVVLTIPLFFMFSVWGRCGGDMASRYNFTVEIYDIARVGGQVQLLVTRSRCVCIRLAIQTGYLQTTVSRLTLPLLSCCWNSSRYAHTGELALLFFPFCS